MIILLNVYNSGYNVMYEMSYCIIIAFKVDIKINNKAEAVPSYKKLLMKHATAIIGILFGKCL